MNVKQVLGALPALSYEELATVRGAIEHLLTTRLETGDEGTLPLYQMVARYVGSRVSFAAFHKSSLYPTWRKLAPHVLEFIDETWPDISKVQRLAMMDVLIGFIITDLADRELPVTTKNIVVNLGRVPLLFDEQFPGYRRSGLAHLALGNRRK